jgi:hypothetical protein
MKIWVWAILTLLLVVEAYVLLVITDLVWFLIILPS